MKNIEFSITFVGGSNAAESWQWRVDRESGYVPTWQLAGIAALHHIQSERQRAAMYHREQMEDATLDVLGIQAEIAEARRQLDAADDPAPPAGT